MKYADTTHVNNIVFGYRIAATAWRRALTDGVAPAHVIDSVRDSTDPADIASLDEMSALMLTANPLYEVGPVCDGSHRALTATIKRLLAEAPAHLPGQAPAIECGVMFVGGAQFLGVLSETPEGGLRMLTQARDQGGVVVMAEQFFDYGDVMVIMIKREVKLESPSSLIIRS